MFERDRAWWDRLRAGDPRAFRELHAATDPGLRARLLKHHGNLGDADRDEVVSRAWLQAYRTLSDFDPDRSSWESWLWRGASWRVRDLYRRRKRLRVEEVAEEVGEAVDLDRLEEPPDPDQAQVCAALLKRLRAFFSAALARLQATYAGKSRRPAGLEHAEAIVSARYGRGVTIEVAGAPFGLTRVQSRQICRKFDECAADHPDRASAADAHGEFLARGCEGCAWLEGENR